MTPAARVQAAIELLDRIIVAARDDGASADSLARAFFRERRYAGSKDRRAIRELVYSAIRRFGDRPENGRAAMIGLTQADGELAALFDGSDYGPPQIAEHEPRASGDTIPRWLDPYWADLVDEREQQTLLDRAPLDIRIADESLSVNEVQSAFPQFEKLPLPYAFRLPAGTSVEAHLFYRKGRIEIQDLGSQAIAEAVVLEKPKNVLDLCAGAGGKTLALAANLPNARIVAADTSRARLNELRKRAERAGLNRIEIILLDPGKERERLAALDMVFECVLVDAPCSGTGTWRRNPELRWRMTPQRLKRIVDLQGRLFDLAADFVKPGGRLVYAVCSLLDAEGSGQVGRFLKQHPKWQQSDFDLPIGRSYRKDMLLTPYHDGTDGFFVSTLQKPC